MKNFLKLLMKLLNKILSVYKKLSQILFIGFKENKRTTRITDNK